MKFGYGKEGLDVELKPEWNVTVFHPEEQEVIVNPVQELRKAIKNPVGCISLNEIIKQ